MPMSGCRSVPDAIGCQNNVVTDMMGVVNCLLASVSCDVVVVVVVFFFTSRIAANRCRARLNLWAHIWREISELDRWSCIV
jgi:hypothetical protein